MEVTIVGAGIGGLTLGLMLHKAGIPSRIFEAAPVLKELGVGINILPHACRELSLLGLEDAMAEKAITTKESAFFNRYGQLIYSEPTGRYAGYEWPQFSIHRGDLHKILLDAYVQRVGGDRLHTGWRCTGFSRKKGQVHLNFDNPVTNEQRESQPAEIAVSCEGIHSSIRKQLYPNEGPPRYSGINMWRGVSWAKPFLTGDSMVRIGWLNTAKVLIYPIRNKLNTDGNQLINWVVDIGTEKYKDKRDWNQAGRIQDFIGAIADWRFDWLDVVGLVQKAETILEYPMVDQDPLPRWTFDNLTLLGDAAHPMYPRGANGSAQAILDARSLTTCLSENKNALEALKLYESIRLPTTAKIVLTNRANPPDAILREVYERTGDKPFKSIDDVITQDELARLSENYQRIAGYHRESLS